MSASKVLFSASEDEILVEIVAKFPCLYDLACSTYKNQVIKDNAWREVAEAVSRSADDCKKRWKNIKDTYMKRKKKPGTGSSASSKSKKWALADLLSFLEHADHQQQTISNIETDGDSIQAEHVEINEEEDQEEPDETPNDEIREEIGNKASSTAKSAPKDSPPSEISPSPPKSKRQRRDKLAGFLEQRQKERFEILKGFTQNQDDEVDCFLKVSQCL